MSIEDNQGAAQVRRTEARLSVAAKAKFREAGTSGTAVRVDDLSRHGFRTEWPYKLKVGDRVWLTLPGISPKVAQVRWVRGFEIGCRFDEAIHPAVFDHLLKRVRRK